MSLELDLNNKSFYDFPDMNVKGSDSPGAGGPLNGIPGREQKMADGLTCFKVVIPSKPRVVQTPENDPRSWNMGGNGEWWSVHSWQPSGDKQINND